MTTIIQVLIGLFLIYYIEAKTDYSDLSILFLRPHNSFPVSPKIENGLAEAITDLKKKVTLLDVTSYKQKVEYSELKRCSSQASPLLNAVDLANSQKFSVNAIEGIPIGKFSFLMFIEVNGPACKKEPNLLATARPCQVSEGNRPILGILNVCPGKHWNGFQAITDLFRHEILHALGFGTLIPISDFHRGPKPEKYIWEVPEGKQTAKRYYLDFSRKVLPIVRKHFGCNLMRGIEADNEKLIHLNEYIYGNELMTPKLSNGKNYFTEITAGILENTFVGSIPWYRVNRTEIASENRDYWYGKNWGCDFVLKSCYEYMRNSLIGFPFCEPNKLDTTYCLNINNRLHGFISKCSWNHLNTSEIADNGVTPVPTLSPYQTGSPALYRFCPMNMDFLNEYVHVPYESTIRKC